MFWVAQLKRRRESGHVEGIHPLQLDGFGLSLHPGPVKYVDFWSEILVYL